LSIDINEKLPLAWNGFREGKWNSTIDVRDFILCNVTPYYGEVDFLADATPRTQRLWSKVMDLFEKERSSPNCVLDVDPAIPSTVTAFGPGYIDKDSELIVGLQTDAPLKRAIMPNGGLRMVEQSVVEAGKEMPKELRDWYAQHRKTHNEGVFDAYTPEIRACRSSGIITGLPDAYGRGRIIGDYRRVALYGTDQLFNAKQQEKAITDHVSMSEYVIREREELSEQLRALKALAQMAKSYGFDISQAAKNAKEAIQWTYFAYLAAVKEQNGAAMSLGRVSTFLDIYIERDLQNGALDEATAQELMDDFVIKLRMIRFLRTDEYNQLFTGDPVWVTEAIGGMSVDQRTLVTKNSYRFLHTLRNLGPSPEPNLTVLWSRDLPENFKDYCAKLSMDTSAIQYENDELMRPKFGDDYGIACCVSPMKIGKSMQFFGARANMGKTLLYALNGGKDEVTGQQIGLELPKICSDELCYEEVIQRFDIMMNWLANTYVNGLNIIHYMHDRYSYEASQMALYDREVHRTLGCGMAGLSVVADSLSAIKYAKVKALRDERGIITDFEITGEYPKYGNGDDRVDQIAIETMTKFMAKIRKCRTYRQAEATQSILTITSNVVYGQKTGNTPDGRRKGEAFAPGANPMHGRDERGAVASLSSVAKLPFDQAKDGISNTFTIVPQALGKDDTMRRNNLKGILDGYFSQPAQHMNVNVLNRELLHEAMQHPEKYPQLTIRVSGYAVNFIKLTKEQQLEVISRTFHEKI
jgi:formate C-acetyltransferase